MIEKSERDLAFERLNPAAKKIFKQLKNSWKQDGSVGQSLLELNYGRACTLKDLNDKKTEYGDDAIDNCLIALGRELRWGQTQISIARHITPERAKELFAMRTVGGACLVWSMLPDLLSIEQQQTTALQQWREHDLDYFAFHTLCMKLKGKPPAKASTFAKRLRNLQKSIDKIVEIGHEFERLDLLILSAVDIEALSLFQADAPANLAKLRGFFELFEAERVDKAIEAGGSSEHNEDVDDGVSLDQVRTAENKQQFKATRSLLSVMGADDECEDIIHRKPKRGRPKKVVKQKRGRQRTVERQVQVPEHVLATLAGGPIAPEHRLTSEGKEYFADFRDDVDARPGKSK